MPLDPTFDPTATPRSDWPSLLKRLVGDARLLCERCRAEHCRLLTWAVAQDTPSAARRLHAWR